jgi:hypothetical protein
VSVDCRKCGFTARSQFVTAPWVCQACADEADQANVFDDLRVVQENLEALRAAADALMLAAENVEPFVRDHTPRDELREAVKNYRTAVSEQKAYRERD